MSPTITEQQRDVATTCTVSPQGEDRRKEVWAQYAASVASNGLPMYDAMLRLRTTSQAWAEFLKHIPTGGTGTSADYGCGTGYVTIALAKNNPASRVIGIERDEIFFTRARKELAACPNTEIRNGDITKRLPLDDGEVNLVGTHNWVIPYLNTAEQEAFIRELGRVQAPGSAVLGSTMLAPFAFRDVVLSNLHAELTQPRIIWIAMRELVPQTTTLFDEHMQRGWMNYPTIDQLREWHISSGFNSFEVVAPIMPLRHLIRWRRNAKHAAVIFRAVRG